MSEVHVSNLQNIPEVTSGFTRLAPLPASLEDSGLSISFIADLVAKHLLQGGVLNLSELSNRIALPGKLLEEIVHFLRTEAKIEVLGSKEGSSELRYNLTDRGRLGALEAMQRSGYVGPAPVPLHQYARVVRQQSVHDCRITNDQMHDAFSDVVLDDELIDQLGPSMNSGRAIFIYGNAGTGKTFIAQRLARLFQDDVLIPHAIAINDAVVTLFDPVLHKPIHVEQNNDLSLQGRHDQRWVLCERPVLVAGGELTADMLEVQLETGTNEYRAPLQLKANNGLFILDDMGRQRVAPEVVFNRWIVPMEEQTDYLSMGSGQHFGVPFDLVLVFSTNLNPTDLADEAFLRRIGYKIRFDPLTRDNYRTIWWQVCETQRVQCDDQVVDFVIEQLHETNNTPLLPCHPRDLIGIATDHIDYLGLPRVLSTEHMRWAWGRYFVSLTPGTEAPRAFNGISVS